MERKCDDAREPMDTNFHCHVKAHTRVHRNPVHNESKVDTVPCVVYDDEDVEDEVLEGSCPFQDLPLSVPLVRSQEEPVTVDKQP